MSQVRKSLWLAASEVWNVTAGLRDRFDGLSHWSDPSQDPPVPPNLSASRNIPPYGDPGHAR